MNVSCLRRAFSIECLFGLDLFAHFSERHILIYVSPRRATNTSLLLTCALRLKEILHACKEYHLLSTFVYSVASYSFSLGFCLIAQKMLQLLNSLSCGCTSSHERRAFAEAAQLLINFFVRVNHANEIFLRMRYDTCNESCSM